MKNLISLIDREIKSRGITAKEMAGRLCVAEGTLSRMRYGKIKDLDPGTLVKMQEGVRSDGDLSKQILVAYLMDKCTGPMAEEVQDDLRVFLEPNSGSEATPILREEPEQDYKPANSNEYSILSETAERLKFTKQIVKVFVTLMQMWRDVPNIPVVLKGLAAGK